MFLNDDRCGYHDDHDEDDNPCGNRCGEPSTKVVRWKDGRTSMACDRHATEVRDHVLHLIAEISDHQPRP
jgi:hypothetical protein